MSKSLRNNMMIKKYNMVYRLSIMVLLFKWKSLSVVEIYVDQHS